MLRTVCLILLFFFIAKQNAYADFFSTCKIEGEERKNVEYVLRNSSNRFIPREIDDIKNETFKNALYLLSFYKEGAAFPEEIIDIIGLNNIKKVYRFKEYVINYVLKKNEGNEEQLKKDLDGININNNDYLFILKNKYFSPATYSKETVKKLLKRVFFNKMLDVSDIRFLTRKYGNYIGDDAILQQIRLRLWNKRPEECVSVRRFIRDVKYREVALKIQEFDASFNKITGRTIKLKNGKTRRSFSKLSKVQKQNICKKWLRYDEYIDLSCIENDKYNMAYVEMILKNNLNPLFLPEKWLKHRLYFVREQVNSGNILTDNIYSIIANGGEMEDDSYYTQQFLAGFISYLRNDYRNAILHFEKCTQISKFAEYNSKAYYWLGLSYRKLGDNSDASNAFNEAKKHTFTMYGQLAASEIEEDPEKNIADHILYFKRNPQILCDDVNFVLGYLEQRKRQGQNLSEILLHYVNEGTEKMKLFNAINIIKNDFGKKSAKTFGFYALRFDVAYDDITFPMVGHDDDSLVNAVIKKESNFKPLTIGGCGERGLMQIMPATGRLLARMMGIRYDRVKLLVNDEYNVMMGKFYLENLLRRYDNNKLLTLAAYNAGGGNVDKWIYRNGDPRDMRTNEEIATWIEKIPFSFTRSYVVHILGFEMVYDVFKKLNISLENN